MAKSDYPRLLFNREGIAGLKGRIETHDWLNRLWQEKVQALDAALAEPVVLPERGGGWWHWYASPTTGAALKTGKQIGQWAWEHIDPVSGEVFRSDCSHPSTDYDLCVLMGVHDGWAKQVRDMGLAYQVTGERKYADRARAILLAYVAAYPGYALHTTRGEAKVGGGKVGPQTLDEAVWLIPFAQGADLVWETLSAEDRQVLAKAIFQVAAREVILPHEMKVHNIQCWKNSAVGLVGFLLDDAELVEQAIDHPVRGYHKQMADGVSKDGQWWEGAWGYHFYTLSSLWPLVEAARNCGVDLYGDALKRMFDAPLVFAMPDLRLPAFNDSGEVQLKGRASIYEIAQARYDNPAYAELLGHDERRSEFSLWFGAEALKPGKERTWKSANLPDSGYAILARGEGVDATWLCFKYGPHGGGHGHPDKLNFVLYAGGEVLGVDPGTARYGLPAQLGWYKTSVAHNVLVVDEASQTSAEGRCLAFGRANGVDYCVGEAGPIYEGVRHVRTVALLDGDVMVVLDQVACEREGLLDVLYHHRGVWQDVPAGTAWMPPDQVGYRYFEEATTRRVSDGIALGLDTGKLVLAGDEATEVIAATGMGHNQKDRVPVVVFRRRAKATAFAWAIALDGSAPSMVWLEAKDASGRALHRSEAVGLRIDRNGRETTLVVNVSGESVQVDGVVCAGVCEVR